MGSLAPASPWFPEDDILLKNAIEAGASLESLAKGAVQFSHKFTLTELQDRWYSLLYDPVFSAKASTHMSELEHDTLNPPQRFTRTGALKENRNMLGKRKANRVRDSYYALRKRYREVEHPFGSGGLSFLEPPNDFVENEDELLPENEMLVDPTSAHYEFGQPEFDINYSDFPEMGGCDTTQGFHTGSLDLSEDNFLTQPEGFQQGAPYIVGNDITFPEARIVDSDGQQELQPDSLFDLGDFEGDPSLPFGQVNNAQSGNACSEFVGKHEFSSPIPDCGPSFDNLEYSSTLNTMPWKIVEGASVCGIPVDGDANLDNAVGCGVDHTEAELETLVPSDGSKLPSGSNNCALAELSHSLFAEEVYIDTDGKDIYDKSSYYDGFSSILLNSPNDLGQSHMPSVTESEMPVDVARDHGSDEVSCLENERAVSISGSGSISTPPYYEPHPEIVNGVIDCVLSTEDQDVPDNDHIFTPANVHPLSVAAYARRNFREPIISCSKNHLSNKGKNEGRSKKKDQKNPRRFCPSSLGKGTEVDMAKLHPVFENNISRTVGVLTKQKPGIVFTKAPLINLKVETEEIPMVRHPSVEKPATVFETYPQGDTCTTQLKQDVQTPIQNELESNNKVEKIDFANQQRIDPTTLELDGDAIDSDEDAPYVSDIEAMILDMDLDPDGPDLFEWEVSKYQSVDIKREIIRLEQSANACMQREIASHGALAIFYGRSSKHFIKKTQVLLGRSTEDLIVDIDLGRGGFANKISRRQAIIYLDEEGTFHLKNLGKFTIFLNEDQIGYGETSVLNSNSFIEIRGMPFAFETNQNRVNQYIESIGRDS